MITIITKITDLKIFKNYWLPLICRHREVQFIFSKIERNNMLDDWSNVKFAPRLEIKDIVPHTKTDVIYITKQNEIPTYELMLNFKNPQEGIVPKILNTNNDSSSFTVLKSKYPNFKRKNVNVSTYVI